MKSRLFLLSLIAAGAAVPAAALDVSGIVMNKLGQQLNISRVCIIGTATCVNTPFNSGAFHIVGSVPVNLNLPLRSVISCPQEPPLCASQFTIILKAGRPPSL